MADALYAGFTAADNQLRMIFLDPASPDFYPAWELIAHCAVSDFRAVSASFPGDPRVGEVINELSTHSPAFADLWKRHDVRPRGSGTLMTFDHAQVGTLKLRYQAFNSASAPGQQLVVHTADPGSASADKLARLAGVLGG